MHPLSPARACALLTLATVVAFAAALASGSVSLPLSAVVRAVFLPTDDTASRIVQQLRLPRALAAFATGGALALAGALLQVLLRNPLADPYVLGISGGAAVG